MKRAALLVLVGAGLACSKGQPGGAMPPAGGGGTSAGGGSGAGAGGAVAGGGGTGGTAAGSGGAGGSGGSGMGGGGAGGATGAPDAGDAGASLTVPPRAGVVSAMTQANDYFMAKWPDSGLAIVTDKSRASNIWTRAVYYEGLMALYGVDPQARYYNYAVQWGTSHAWGLNNGVTTTSADDQCAGQTYIDLYNIDAQAVRIHDIKADIDQRLTVAMPADWTWVDAIQMAMPVYARLGVLTGTTTYFNQMYALYSNAKNVQGANGYYSKTQHLWWRDQDFDPPYVEPNGQDCFWSRGNGWAYTALVRVLDILPAGDPHRAEYLADFQAMSEALRAVQRSDGYWNVSLHDPTHFGGKELTGTALFTFGMAWGSRKGFLAASTYVPIAVNAWNAMVTNSLHTNGSLGWVQGTGKQPSDGQPVTADSVPDFEDFGLGCFLLAGSEIAKLSP